MQHIFCTIKFRMAAAAVIAALSPAALAQSIAIGVKGGLRLTSDVGGDATSDSRRYVVGPMMTVNLPLGFMVEGDALYRRFAFRSTSYDILGGSSFLRGTANAWEFPILLRRGLFKGIYASVGYAPRVVNGTSHYNWITKDLQGNASYSTASYPTEYQISHGVVAGAGVEKRFGFLYIAPEVRYTHWNRPSVQYYGSHGYQYYGTQDQVDILVGIRFP